MPILDDMIDAAGQKEAECLLFLLRNLEHSKKKKLGIANYIAQMEADGIKVPAGFDPTAD